MEDQQASLNNPPTPQQSSPTQSQQEAPQTPVSGGPNTNIQSSSTQPTSVIYASFLKRLLAGIIDGIILTLINAAIQLPFSLASFTTSSVAGPIQIGFETETNITPTIISLFISITVPMIYQIGSLTWKGATIGKMALGLVVVNTEQEKITLSKAALRETIGKFVSGIVLGLGYLWVIWDEKKQGWHDKIAGTVVVEKKSLPQ